MRTLPITTALLLCLSACVNLSPEWQLQKQRDGIDYFTRQSQHASLPEFKASIQVDASIAKVMELVTDFSRHPEWVYRCEQITVIALKGYSEAYLYQVNKLPIVADRDMILHGRTLSSEEGDQIRIQLSAAPNYCDNNDDEDCESIAQSKKVRVREADGEFVLNKIDKDTTQIVWQQFLDPGGAIPHWLFRALLAQVPMQSLRQLKLLLESEPK